MKRQKIVLKHCPHFYKILDFEIYEDDVISSKLISLYKENKTKDHASASFKVNNSVFILGI